MTQVSLFIFIIEVLGTIAFAISGIRLAAAKKFDWFGAYIVGLVTAIGGGTLRDLLLGIPVFWMQSPMYLAVTFLSLMTVIVFRKALVKGMRTLFLFDAIGLALFRGGGHREELCCRLPRLGGGGDGHHHRLVRRCDARYSHQRRTPLLPQGYLCYSVPRRRTGVLACAAAARSQSDSTSNQLRRHCDRAACAGCSLSLVAAYTQGRPKDLPEG